MSEVKQVGGSHYRSSYQHWDWAEEVGLGYLEGCASKYLVRWREKGGVEDLKKALSYVRQLSGLHLKSGRENRCLYTSSLGVNMLAFRRLIEENSIPTYESTVCLLLQVWRDDTELDAAAQMIEWLINQEIGDATQSDLQAGSSFSNEDAPDALPPEPASIYVPEPASLLAEAMLSLAEKRDTIPAPQSNFSGECTFTPYIPPAPAPLGEPLDGYVDQDRQSIDFPF